MRRPQIRGRYLKITIPNLDYERIVEYEPLKEIKRKLKKILVVAATHPEERTEEKPLEGRRLKIYMQKRDEDDITPFQIRVVNDGERGHFIDTELELEREMSWAGDVLHVVVEYKGLKHVMNEIQKVDPWNVEKNIRKVLHIKPLDFSSLNEAMCCPRRLKRQRPQSARTVFDSRRQRMTQDAKSVYNPVGQQKPLKKSWKAAHEQFLSIVRSARAAKHMDTCTKCHRQFTADRIQKHEDACLTLCKREVFNSKAQRVTEEAQRASNNASPIRIAIANKYTRFPCPHCHRLFAEKAYDRHVTVCNHDQEKRSTFNSAAQRVGHLAIPKRRINRRRKPIQWRRKHVGWKKFVQKYQTQHKNQASLAQKRYPEAIRILKEMGFEDTPRVNDMLLKTKGNLRTVLETLLKN